MRKNMQTLKLDGCSLNQQEAILELLKKNAPEVFSEDKIDVKQLRATLGDEVMADTERYGLNWAGKMDCFRTIQDTTTNTLKPARDESVNFDDTKNLFIEGDNLEVLKILQKSYYGKVKMIYIDPPYNTGNDFIYNDKFSRNKREYLEDVGAIDKEGNVVNAGLYTQNTKDSGHFHSDWLNMMYPRLFLAKNLLRQDGVIFVSIDDNEVHNLRMVMNEIFGEENFVAQFVWKSKGSGAYDTKSIKTEHEYIFVYAKNCIEAKFREMRFDVEHDHQYKFSDERLVSAGKYKRQALAMGTLTYSASLDFAVKNPDGEDVFPGGTFGKGYIWRWQQEKIDNALREGFAEWVRTNNGWSLYSKQYQYMDSEGSVVERTVQMTTIIDDVLGRNGTQDLQNLFNEKIFLYPKPTILIKKFSFLVSTGSEIVLDFFAGSGTTAHAVMQLNAEDGGNRRWICVQLPEKCKPETEAAKVGFVTIADIAKERIRRAGRKITEENPDKHIDVGFQTFKLDESNFKIWNTQIENVEQLEQQMLEMFDNVREGSTEEAMLYELILKSGKELTVAIEEKEAGGEKFFRINDGSLVICLSDHINEELFAGILAEQPKKIILLDKGFRNNDQLKTNLLLHAEGAGVDEVRVI
jgi:adenine-specific DNA-methyltransferase